MTRAAHTTVDQVAAARLAAQGLTRRDRSDPVDVVDHLLAVQAQDLRGARLSIRSRSTGADAADVDAALGAGRLVVTWLNRGTLHLVTAADYWWLHPLTTPQLATANARRLEQEGVSPAQAERGVEVVTAAVADGPRTRTQLRDALDAAGVPTRRQALVHVLFATALRGHIVRGPVAGTEQAFVSVPQWLGEEPEPVERTEALGRLAARYLRSHGPATAGDLARWAGITLGDARAGLAAAVEVTELADLGDGLVDLAGRADAVGLPPPRLLGPFDPLLLGWLSRDAVVGSHVGVVTVNGLFRATALVDGRVVGTWGLSSGVLTITPLQAVPRRALAALQQDALDVLRFLGLPPRPAVVAATG